MKFFESTQRKIKQQTLHRFLRPAFAQTLCKGTGLCLLLLTSLMAGHRAMAQAVSGTIVGTVTDATGAVVAGAQVSIVLTGQSTAYSTVTNESGNYTEPNLPPGTYSVTVTANGFKKQTQENVSLLTNTTDRIDLTLATGSTTETVTVSAAPPLLQTDRADISTNIEQRQIADLPLSSGNSFQSLLQTVPGMAPLTFNNSQFFNANNDISTNANGQSTYVNLYQIEGIDDDQRTGIHIILVPPAAAIANVDITTNNFEAEFGRAVGTVVNVTLKSGTNKFHGSAFHSMENNGVNARNYFATGPNGRLVYNYSGGSFGGPILKDKLFIFGDILRTSDHESTTYITSVPYYNVVNNSLNLSGYSGQVYDPNTGDTADCTGSGATANNCGTGRTPFAGNIIPLNNPGISPISVKVLTMLDALSRNPATNLSAAKYTSGVISNNFSSNLPFHKDAWSYDIKSDYAISQKDHLSGRFSHQTTNTFQAPVFGSFLGGPAGGGGFEATGVATAYSTGGNYDHTFSPTLFTEVRAGVAHLRNSATQTDYGQNDAKTLGIPGNGPNGTNNTLTTSGQVAFTLNNFNGPLIGYSASLPWLRAESNIDVANNWTKIIKNHQLKAGADIRRIRDDLLQGNNNAAAGQFYFSENQTSAPGATSFNGAATGQANDIASLLFGVPNKVGQDTNSTFPAYRQSWLFFFVSDKWQATSKLTVDVGLRYELYPPATPRKAGGFVNYDPTTNKLIMAGVAGNPSNLGMQSNYKNFAPRLGASFRATDSLVIRGGFGVSYVPFVDNTYAYNYPIKTSTAYNNTPAYGAALNPAGGYVNFVTGIPATPTIAFGSDGTLTESAANGTIGLANLYIPKDFKNPYVTSWNVALQQALPENLSLQIAYVANHGTRISVAQNINQPRVYGQSGTSDPLNIAFGKTAAVTQYFMGTSNNFQSLQVQLIRRMTKGLAFTSAFTWSKAQGYVTGAQDGALLFFAGDLRRNYTVLDFDRTINYAQTVTYELPFGRGKKYLNHGPLVYALGGWKASAIVTAVTGSPFTITTSSPTPGTAQTVNMNGTYHVTHARTGAGNVSWFDPSVFSAPATGIVGNTQRNQFRGPADFGNNLSLFKAFPIFRESNLEVRADAFNLTNTPQFANPSATLGSTLGRVTGTLGSGVGNVNGVGGPRVLQAGAKLTF
ncbi:Carboxypeptidase regulatory-like domain-containing protein [Granulicella pectinivorans]|uniref:Carboxypeptidase regulatory-like domain-containing protein n=1 Tax=Granulicella pectinivorans TaxID=474950 RepID=A0A1I6LUH0_9BACT|nr:carboxypeptidase regulatory-like domain-containing protein [Granulicella pectinivorans]SFS07020.1 Carboxypeptidase regulatory-like domain-containing protein [Granulicella pectinivorans]